MCLECDDTIRNAGVRLLSLHLAVGIVVLDIYDR